MAMEAYVADLLRNADLSVITKKHIRMKYREHVGRELDVDEKERVNKLVYDFVDKLSQEQRKSTENTPEKGSPGNKENVNGNKRKTSKFIIRGQVVDRKDVQKRKEKSSPKKSPKTPVDRSDLKQYPKRTRSPRIMFSDVMSAIIESSDNEGSVLATEEESSEGEEEEEEEKEETRAAKEQDLSRAVQELKEAREKKIQMSQEKKKKSSTIDKGKRSNCMRKLCSDDEEGQEKSSPESSTPHASDVGTPQSSPEKMLVIKPKRKHVFDSDSEDESHKRDAKRRKLEIRVKRLEESPYKMPSVEKLRVKRIEESPRRTPSVEKMRVKRIGESPRKIPSVESDTDDSMDVPLAKKKKQLQERQTADTACVKNPADIDRTSDSDQSDLDSDLKETPTKKSSNGHVADSSESDFQMLGGSSGALRTKQRYSEHSDSESEVSEISSIKGSNVDLPEEKVSNVSTERVKQKKKKSLADSDVATGVSSDEDEPIIKTKSKIKKKQGSSQSRKKAAAGKTTVKESNRLKSLRKICQACGMFVWNDPKLKECTSDVARIKRLKTLLTAAGMKGRPSLKKAEEIKLQKEAAELNSNNIISNEPSRGKRKVASKYSRRVKSPKKSQSPQKPVSNPFSRLKGIVDSENSDSD